MEDNGEELITENMVKKVTYLVHKLADRRGGEYKDVLAKCKKMFAYTNLAKVSLEDGHAIISKLIELTGGEEEEQQREQKDDLSPQEGKEDIKEQEKEKSTYLFEAKKEKEPQQEDDLVTSTMRKAIRAAVDITIKEVVDKEVPVQGLGGFVLEIGKVIFEAKMAEEAEE